jgi:sugar phosphate isomerase/epimerase
MKVMISRRALLQAASFSAVTGGVQAAKLKKVGVQLYTVRTVLPTRMEETLKAIEAAGYREIEATWADLDKLLTALKSTRLKPVSVHLDARIIGSAPEDELSKAVDLIHRGGFDYAVHPYVPAAERGGLDAMKALAEKLNRAGEKFRKAGIGLCYHNHAFEFESIGGTTPFQVLLDRTDKKLMGIEMDVFWVSVAGLDPSELLPKLAGRVPLIHVKDKASGTPVMFNESVPRTAFKEAGAGVVDWAKVFRAARPAGVKHYFVEQDQTPGDPVESLRQSYTYLAKLSY